MRHFCLVFFLCLTFVPAQEKSHYQKLYFEQDDVRKKYSAIVVLPQCAENSTWPHSGINGDSNSVMFAFYEDAKPTTDMLLPEGLIGNLITKKPKHIDWWVFNGDVDNIVPAKYFTQMIGALEKEGISVAYSPYPRLDHNGWDNAFAEPDLLPWLFSKSK